HTPVVQLHLRYGMILFIASEVMFFAGWFWAWFDFALFPNELTEVVGGVFPPAAIEAVMDPFALPLLNTLILLCSGTTLTYAHHSLIHGDRDGLKKGLWMTVALGVLFTCIQAYEYMHAPFDFGGNTYSSAFYMATGFHGFHVLVGTLMLIACLRRAFLGPFTPRQHCGFEAAAWYWHFVDVVWLFLFIVVYVWGGWGAEFHEDDSPYSAAADASRRGSGGDDDRPRRLATAACRMEGPPDCQLRAGAGVLLHRALAA